MSYDTAETSSASGRPVELYTFARGSKTWRYTSADRDVVVDGNTHTAAVILRNGISQGSELNRSALTLRVPRSFALAELYRAGIPVDTITLRVHQYHEGDGEVVGVWGGRLVNCTFEAGAAVIACEPVQTSIRTLGLRRMFQRQCPHVLYGAGCGVDPEAFKATLTVSAVTGLAVTATGLDAEADGWWEGGYLRWQTEPGVYERRWIEGHTGTTVTLTTQPLGLAVDDEIEVFPGCDHFLSTCDAKFDNRLNYGGMPDIPQKNPFGNDPIY